MERIWNTITRNFRETLEAKLLEEPQTLEEEDVICDNLRLGMIPNIQTHEEQVTCK